MLNGKFILHNLKQASRVSFLIVYEIGLSISPGRVNWHQTEIFYDALISLFVICHHIKVLEHTTLKSVFFFALDCFIVLSCFEFERSGKKIFKSACSKILSIIVINDLCFCF